MRPGRLIPAVTPRRAARGSSLFEALIAMAILAFGMLGMLHFQGRLVAQGSEAQARVAAAQLGDELLNRAIVDIGNAGCYATVPATSPCGSPTAAAQTQKWKERALATLPGRVTATSTLVGSQLLVELSWTGKTAGENRTLQAVTDVHP